MTNLTFEVFIPQNQRRNALLIEKIIMLGGQINAPSENATVHAPYTQLSAAAPELLNSLLEIIDSQIPNLDKSD